MPGGTVKGCVYPLFSGKALDADMSADIKPEIELFCQALRSQDSDEGNGAPSKNIAMNEAGESVESKMDVMVICEGCATGYSCALATGYEVVCCRSANNMLPVAERLRNMFPARKFILGADNDHIGGSRVNVGVDAARKAAQAIGGYVAIPEPIDAKSTDFDDVRRNAEMGLFLIEEAFNTALQKGAADSIPPGYKYNSTTGLLISPDGPVCTGIFFAGRARNAVNESWSTVIHVKDHDGQKHSIVASQDEIASASSGFFSKLNNAGFQLWDADPKTRQHLCSFIMGFRTSRRICLAQSTGWYDDNAYILPRETLYRREPRERVEFNNPNFDPGFSTGGTLEKSLEMLGLIAGSPLCETVIYHCLAGPLLPLLDCQGTGLLLTGDSSSGKTTTMRAAASLQGAPGQIVRSCRSTANALEVIFAMHNHGYLCLDEIGEMTAKDLDQITYMGSNGQGKNRMRADSSLRQSRRWLCNFVCTGEKTVADKLMEGGFSPMAGQEVRLPSLSADGGAGLGIFSVLPEGIDSGHALADRIEELAHANYGHVFPEFIKYILDKLADADFIPSLKAQMAECKKKILPENCGRQMRRIASHLVVDVVAGELGIEAEVLPEKFKPVDSIRFCLNAIAAERGTVEDMESRNILEAFERMIVGSGNSRFESILGSLPEDQVRGNRIGFYEVGSGYTDYIIPCSKFKEEMKVVSVRKALQVLKDAGILQESHETKNGREIVSPSESLRLPRMATMRGYRFRMMDKEASTESPEPDETTGVQDYSLDLA